jgi:hypothetical protein
MKSLLGFALLAPMQVRETLMSLQNVQLLEFNHLLVMPKADRCTLRGATKL